jgi:hypothetical protein
MGGTCVQTTVGAVSLWGHRTPHRALAGPIAPGRHPNQPPNVF